MTASAGAGRASVAGRGRSGFDARVCRLVAPASLAGASCAPAAGKASGLAALRISGVVLRPAFSADTFAYTGSVANSNSSVTLTPVRYDGGTTVQLRTCGGAWVVMSPAVASVSLPLNVGSNAVEVMVTAHDGSARTYSLKLVRQSGDASLAALTVGACAISPLFDAGTLAYSASVPGDTASTTLTPVCSDAHALVQLRANGIGAFVAVGSGQASPPLALAVGNNLIEVKVTAQSNWVRTYAIVIVRPSNVASLTALRTSAGALSPAFSADTFDYCTSVASSNSSVTLTPVRSDSNATVQLRLGGGALSVVPPGAASAALPLNVGSNLIEVLVTAQDGGVRIYSVTVMRLSSDASLAALTASACTLVPAFDGGTLAYHASVAGAVDSLTLTPACNDAHAQVRVRANGAGAFAAVAPGQASPALALAVGSNRLELQVCAQDGSLRSYVVTVARPSNVASLAALRMGAGVLSPAFAADTLAYSASVANGNSSLTLTPVRNNASATVQVRIGSGAVLLVPPGAASAALPLNVGSNLIEVLVTAQDGSVRIYTVTVTRLSGDASLAALTANACALVPVFDSGTLRYSASVASAVDSVTLTPTCSDAQAQVRVRANRIGAFVAVAPSQASPALELAIGSNLIEVKVTAQNNCVRTYAVTVMRPSGVASLAALRASVGVLSPAFAADTLAYTAIVANGSSSMTLTPVRNDADATVQVRIGGAVLLVPPGAASAALPLNVGSNLIEVLVTAQDGGVRAYTVTVVRLSSDASLAALTASACTLGPAFDSGTLHYSASVASAVDSMTLTPACSDAHAQVRVRANGIGAFAAVAPGQASPALPLAVGSNRLELQVCAQDGSLRSYVVTVTRPSSVASLAALTLGAGVLSPAFAADTLAYTASVANHDSSVTLTPLRNDADATIQLRVGAGAPLLVPSGAASAALPLNVGSNLIEVLVTAQDGSVRIYAVTVMRLSSDASLAALTASACALVPAFDAGTLAYSASVAGGIDSLTLTPACSDARAQVRVRANGAGAMVAVAPGQASPALALAVGSNRLELQVCAQDGSLRNYVVTVNRPSSVASLAALTLSAGALNPTFSADTLSYTASVANRVSSLLLTPALNDSNANIELRVGGAAPVLVASGAACAALPLNVGSNTIALRVMAQDGRVQTYTLTVLRQSSDASLVALTASACTLSPPFHGATLAYSASVAGGVDSLTLTPACSDPQARVRVRANGAGALLPVAPGQASPALALAVGSNRLELQVCAQDGSLRSYVVTVRRPSGVASLALMALGSAALSPAFAAGTLRYTASVAYDQRSVRLTPVSNDPHALIEVGAAHGWGGRALVAVPSGAASAPLPLQVGSNMIEVRVTAPDGSVQAYVAVVTRAVRAPGMPRQLPAATGLNLLRHAWRYFNAWLKQG